MTALKAGAYSQTQNAEELLKQKTEADKANERNDFAHTRSA